MDPALSEWEIIFCNSSLLTGNIKGIVYNTTIGSSGYALMNFTVDYEKRTCYFIQCREIGKTAVNVRSSEFLIQSGAQQNNKQIFHVRCRVSSIEYHFATNSRGERPGRKFSWKIKVRSFIKMFPKIPEIYKRSKTNCWNKAQKNIVFACSCYLFRAQIRSLKIPFIFCIFSSQLSELSWNISRKLPMFHFTFFTSVMKPAKPSGKL